ncbi:GNAT family N-acetyltransferase [Sutcliffiella sp. NPDC057660]|uniref:GNAT family N-acetyltransferase n=1 Tax=Sutcliffiella sp. NPDC057660 TaxID=3346199 RepID=UPI0036AFD9EF
MEIRKLQSSDAEKYFDLRLEALQTNPEAFASSYEEESKNTPEIYQNRLEGDFSYTFGAFEQEELIGVASLVLEQKNKIKHRANIYGVYVTPEKRGLGVARKIMEASIKKARQLEGVEQIHLTVTASNEPAKKLYQSLGFKTYGIEKKALKLEHTYFDEELMVLFI